MAGPRSTSLTQTRVRKAPTLLEEKLFLEAVTTADAKLEKDAKPAPPGGRARRAAISISTSPKASAGILRRRAISVERLVPVAALAEILSPKHGSPKLFSPKNVSTPKPKVMSPKKMAKLLAGSPPRANGRAFTVPVLEYRTEDFLQGQQKNYRNLRIFPDESFGLYPKESEDTESRSPKYLPPGILHELSFEEKLLAIQSARKAARRLSRFSLGSGDLGLDEEGGEVDEERAPVGPREKQQSKKESSHFPARRMTAFDEDIRRAATLAQDEGAVFRKRRASSRSKKSSRGSIDRVEEVAPVSVRASRGPSDIPAPVVVSRNTPPLPSVTVTKEDQPPPRRANAFATVGRSVAAFHRPRLINHAAQLNVPTTTRPLTKQIAEGTNIVEEEFLQKIRANELVGVRDMLNQCAREKRNGAKDLLFSDKVCCKALALAAENRNAEIARLLVKYASASGSLTMVPDPVVDHHAPRRASSDLATLLSAVHDEEDQVFLRKDVLFEREAVMEEAAKTGFSKRLRRLSALLGQAEEQVCWLGLVEDEQARVCSTMEEGGAGRERTRWTRRGSEQISPEILQDRRDLALPELMDPLSRRGSC